MYLFIIAIHAVFIGLSHLLGYRIIEILFFLLGIFFLFYFSPLFFVDGEKQGSNKKLTFSLFSELPLFSLKNSIILPVLLLYIALYGFVFSIFGSIYSFLTIHATIICVIYIIFIGYTLSFYWKQDVFFELFRFHILFTLLSSVIFSVSILFHLTSYQFLHFLIGIIGIISSFFLLSFTKKENIYFLSSFLFSLVTTSFFIPILFGYESTLIQIVTISIVSSFIIFDILPRIRFLEVYTSFFQYFSLFTLLFSLPLLYFIAYTTIQALSILLLIGVTLFFLSIHIRYTNYIVFSLSLINIYFIYSLIFIDLLLHPTILSSFLFIFFLPILLIGTTYFWDEQNEYDFSILHYGSIAFSIVYVLYSLLFIGWGGDLLFITSLFIFGIAFLLFLSYFRFRTQKTYTH